MTHWRHAAEQGEVWPRWGTMFTVVRSRGEGPPAYCSVFLPEAAARERSLRAKAWLDARAGLRAFLHYHAR